MKKIFLIIIIFIFAQIAISCTIPAKSKSCNYYYTSKLLKKISEDKDPQIKALNMSYYKIKILSSEEKSIVLNYLRTVIKSDFKDSKEFKEKPVYRLYINFNDETYIIDIFSKEDIGIFPYDGNLQQDVVKMNSKYKCYNLYYLCKNIFN
jgi:hypothetical protein